jgi:hypothetical protein
LQYKVPFIFVKKEKEIAAFHLFKKKKQKKKTLIVAFACRILYTRINSLILQVFTPIMEVVIIKSHVSLEQ